MSLLDYRGVAITNGHGLPESVHQQQADHADKILLYHLTSFDYLGPLKTEVDAMLAAGREIVYCNVYVDAERDADDPCFAIGYKEVHEPEEVVIDA